MKISALLNPSPDTHHRRRSSRTRRLTNEASPVDDSSDYVPEDTSRKSKGKQTKDAPKFERGEVVGTVNFPPHDTFSADIAKHLKDFKIFPSTGISAYPRHIPYSSDKKDFLTKTGRDSFEVFQYTFKVRGNDKEWTVMWDYNIGLVRITPFFKCLGYAKTIPAKAIGASPGLRELCHSITGGALAAQGYWMPYDAAIALAANFCWDIRHALVPLFGKQFIDMCLRPEHPSYKRHALHPSIIKKCQQDMESWKHWTVGVPPNVLAASPPETPRQALPLMGREDWSQRTLRARPGRPDVDEMAFDRPVPAFNLTPLHHLPRPNFMMERFLSQDHERMSPSASTCVSSATSTDPTGSPRSKRTFSELEDREESSLPTSHMSFPQKRQRIDATPDEEAEAALWLVQLSMDERVRGN